MCVAPLKDHINSRAPLKPSMNMLEVSAGADGADNRTGTGTRTEIRSRRMIAKASHACSLALVACSRGLPSPRQGAGPGLGIR